jgi:anhydro-N-acetylmuramic acid kinase
LKNYWNKFQPEEKLVVGLMSGTSADGIDACLVKIFPDFSIKFIDGIVYEYPENIRIKIFEIFRGQASIEDICWMNFAIGEIFSEAALEVIQKAGFNAKDVHIVASHGQTVFHRPQNEFIDGINKKSTLQIGEGAVICEKTGIMTISDFRTADIASGGQGAPLVSFVDEIMFKKDLKTRAVQNIGGIANVTVVGSNFETFGFDTGPGNVMIDFCTSKFFNQKYDKDGVLASKGTVNKGWLEKLMEEDYYKILPPKTTGRELFSPNYIEKKLLDAPENPYDIISTLTALTSNTIFKAYKDFVFPVKIPDEIIIGGGGGYNPIIIKNLQELFKEKIKILRHEDFGIPDKFKEAMAFALLGYTCFYQIPNNLPSCTGAKHKAVLGKISFPV